MKAQERFPELASLSDRQIDALRAFVLGCNLGGANAARAVDYARQFLGVEITRACVWHFRDRAYTEDREWFTALGKERDNG